MYIDTRQLQLNDKLIVTTQNSTYKLIKQQAGYFLATGGKYFPIPTLIYLAGSTWGGSCLRMGVLAPQMHAEMHIGNGKSILTSRIQNVKLISEKYEYDFQWQDIKIAEKLELDGLLIL